MTVCRLVDGIKSRGGSVTHLFSYCGGLPAPIEAANPIGYKWSWSPRGALLAMNNGATWLQDKRVTTLAAGEGRLLASATPFHLPGHPAYALELLPNRDSLPYASKYAVEGPALQSIKRGTLRYGGFSARMGLLASIGMFSGAPQPIPAYLISTAAPSASSTPSPFTVPLRALLAACAGLPSAGTVNAAELAAALCAAAQRTLARAEAEAEAEGSGAKFPAAAACAAGGLAAPAALEFLHWLGLESPATITPTGTPTGLTFVPVDSLLTVLAPHPGMALGAGAPDLVLMSHQVTADFPSGAQEVHSSTLVQYGSSAVGGVSAMSVTVGITAAAGAGVLLGLGYGGVGAGAGVGAPRGVITPNHSAWYTPILQVLQEEGVEFVESVRSAHA